MPAILCGMIGSNLGWSPAPYVDCPASVADLAANLRRVAEDVWIAPGLRCPGVTGEVDVMRGEETQILGWLAQGAGPQGDPCVICHPGTHAKWAVVRGNQILRFVTAMTGELFSLLTRHSVLRSDEALDDPAAFDAGVDAAGCGDALAARLFVARARVVGGGADARTTPSFLSGLLIGSEIASMPGLLGLSPDRVVLLGDTTLCAHYARAFARLGFQSVVFDGAPAAITGLLALYQAGVAA